MKLEVSYICDDFIEITAVKQGNITQETFDKNGANELAIELLGVVKELVEFSKQNY